MPYITPIEAYAKALMEVINSKKIQFNMRTNLIAVDSERKIAIFELMDEDGKIVEKKVSFIFLHMS